MSTAVIDAHDRRARRGWRPLTDEERAESLADFLLLELAGAEDLEEATE